MRTAVYAGAFDPVTRGHLSVVEAAAKAFDHVVVLVARHPDKTPLFSMAERRALIEEATGHIDNVSADVTDGYVVEYARGCGARFLIRGVRGATDSEEETKLAQLNRELAPEIETFFVPANDELATVSSSHLKQMARRGEDGAPYCPPGVWEKLQARLQASFEVLPLGVGDTFSELYNPSSLLLGCGGRTLGIDCPDGYRRILKEAREHAGASITLEKIDDFVLTHVHGDHINGLEGIGFYKRFRQNARPRLYTSQPVADVLWDGRLRASMGRLYDGEGFTAMHLEDYFELVVLTPGEPTQVGPFAITIQMTTHHVPTFASLVTAEGRTLGYSGDTAFDPALVAFLDAADLVIHETSLGPAHTPLADLAALPSETRDKTRLIHYPDELDPASSPLRVLRQYSSVKV